MCVPFGCIENCLKSKRNLKKLSTREDKIYHDTKMSATGVPWIEQTDNDVPQLNSYRQTPFYDDGRELRMTSLSNPAPLQRRWRYLQMSSSAAE